MLGDITSDKDDEIFDYIKNFGVDELFYLKDGKIHRYSDEKEFPLTVYNGADYDFVIRKGKYNIVTDLEKNGFSLDKGLCRKLKENEMFVMFKFSSLTEAEDIHKVYKSFYRNAVLCNDYSVPSLFVSFADSRQSIKSSMQLVSFAEEFGYSYQNLVQSWRKLLKSY